MAAERGHDSAINNLGYMYCEGLGVEQDYYKALELHEKSAKAGSEYGQENVEHVKKLIEKSGM